MREANIVRVQFIQSLDPELFLSASFLELLNQLFAVVFAHERPLVINREPADLLALWGLRKMADGSRR